MLENRVLHEGSFRAVIDLINQNKPNGSICLSDFTAFLNKNLKFFNLLVGVIKLL